MMDEHGFLPPHGCRICGTPLCGQGGDRPAELYAGTYTGLCYRCERGQAFLVITLGDGAQVWSHPPHCPSWRRTRETFTGYADCPGCRGMGMIWVSRSDNQGGSYSVQCDPCMARFSAHPLRRWYWRRSEQHSRAVRLRMEWVTSHHPKSRWQQICEIYWPIQKLIRNRGMEPMDRMAKANNLY